MSDLQTLCALGQQKLMEMEYLEAEALLAEAEHEAWVGRDFDSLSRLYMPLQEARRQRRQRCGEGIVRLDLIADGPDDRMEARHVAENFPHGQLLVAGWKSIRPAAELRALQKLHGLYLETFLAAAYPVGERRAVVIVPLEDVSLPEEDPASIDELLAGLPAHCIVFSDSELPQGPRRGDTGTFAEIMALWERLHLPFLAGADMMVDPMQKMEGYRKTIRVDYACELAHQKLSDVAKEMARKAS
ncbi:MAG TPA: hypothetical protein VIL86_17485 [Tepidisphaeraceae bacterium]